MTRTTIEPQQAITDGYRRALELIDHLPHEWQVVGRNWYPHAYKRVQSWAHATGYSESQVAAVLANYNINSSWTAAKTRTRRALMDGDIRGMAYVQTAVRAIVSLPRDATHEDVLPFLTNGLKTNNFYWSLLDIAGCACDRWMFDVWQVYQHDCHYPIVEAGVTKVARTYNLELRHAQSLIWMARVYAKAKTMEQYRP